jgi:hypothetical protein
MSRAPPFIRPTVRSCVRGLHPPDAIMDNPVPTVEPSSPQCERPFRDESTIITSKPAIPHCEFDYFFVLRMYHIRDIPMQNYFAVRYGKGTVGGSAWSARESLCKYTRSTKPAL